MTVCDLTHAYHATSGGIRTYIDAKRRYVLDHTDHAHVAVVPGERDGIQREERATTITVEAPLIRGAAPYRWFSRPGRVLAALVEAAPDVVEVGTFYMPTEWGPALAWRRRARRSRPAALAMQAHTDFAASYAEVYAGKLLGPTLGRGVGRAAAVYARTVLGRADLCLAPSPFQAARVTGHGLGDVHVVTPGVDPEVFSPAHADAALRDRLGVPEGGVLAVYTGRLDSEKRTPTLVEAVRRADAERAARLVFVGEGPHRAGLEAREAAGDPIRVLPFLTDRAALARLLASADVYLTAGPHETFGLSVIEAQACGLPVVGVAAGALIERVPPGTGFLGPVDDAEAMSQNLLRAADDRARLGAAARQHAVEAFSWQASFDRLFSLYETALAT